ncbi:MAG: carbamate kinase, partial [Fidelibacterota bacterium]
LPEMSIESASRWLKEGQFPPGSMGPKITAAIDFLKRGGQSVLITSIDKIDEALQGTAGTVLRR